MHWGVLSLLIFATACLHKTQAQVVGHLPEFLPRYKLVSKFPGGIQDQASETILLQNYGGAVERFDLASRTLSLLATNLYSHPIHLIPAGIITYSTNGLLQLEGTNEINLGAASINNLLDYGTRVIEGRFGILRTPEGRVLRDFFARTNLLISTNDGFVDVSANGSVAFTELANGTNIAIRWYNNGRFETLALLPSFPLPHVATDGTNVLWSEPNPPFGSVFLQTPTAQIQLSTNTALMESGFKFEAPRRHSVAMKNGWTIFPRWETNNPGTLNNLWRRSPTGEITQLTTKPGFVFAIAEDGGAIIEGGDGRIEAGLYYISPTGDTKPVGGGAPLARYFAWENKFYAYSPLQSGGSGLYEIELQEDPFGMIYPAYSLETGLFSVDILPSIPGTFVLERTSDFIEWSPIETITLDGIGAFRVEVASPPGFFRLRKQ